MIKFIHDEDGIKTDVIVPIKLWNEIEKEHITISQNDDAVEYIFLEKHYNEILNLLDRSKSMTTELWTELYNEYFKYYNALDKYDIDLLFYFRMNNSILNHSNDIEHQKVQKIDNSNLSDRDLQDIRDNAKTLNEFSFLQYFKLHYKTIFTTQVDTTKRLQRLPDRNRLFIYDVLKIQDMYMRNLCFKESATLLKSKKELITILADCLYNGQDAPIYRLNNEVEERVNI